MFIEKEFQLEFQNESQMILSKLFFKSLMIGFGLILGGFLQAEEFPDQVHFNRDVRPILSDNCFTCHGPDEGQRKAKLRLDIEAGISAALKNKVIVKGKALKSELLKRILTSDLDERMPPKETGKKLNKKQIEILKRWIDQGAKWQDHWAYIAPRKPPVPEIKSHPEIKNPIDKFLYVKAKSRKVASAKSAAPHTLIRRLSLDLIGLPPQASDVDRFVKKPTAQAYEELVEKFLSSKHYGERMGVHWLDLVRYADSVGYHKDSNRNVWLYRDYVIDAFNDNLPFDQFVKEQLAGDLLKGNKFEEYRWKVASGFNRMNQTTSEGGAQAGEYLAKYGADRVRNTAAIFLGSTFGCSECHDHKFDPFTQKDFYTFQAFFADLKERGVGFPRESHIPTRQQLEEWQKAESELIALKSQANLKDAQVEVEIKSLEEKIKQLSDSKKWPRTIVTETTKPRTIRVLARGNWLDKTGPVVQPAIPEFLGKIESKDRLNRLNLAEWIASRKNPLTARVFVNRVWKLFMGKGISRVLDDLGSQGDWPSHPELLDWLAMEFIDSGWNVKHIVKLIVTSKAYQQGSHVTEEQVKLDPENRLFMRQNQFRLTAEFVRDNALSISGLLSPKMGGRSVKPYQPANYWFRIYKDARYTVEKGENQYRRGVYTYWRRSFWHPSLQAFDAPAREECVAERPISNTPQQALVLLNDPTYVEAARALAVKMIKEGGAKADQRIHWAFKRAMARQASKLEFDLLMKLQADQLKRYLSDEKAAKAFLSVGDLKVPEGVDLAKIASWTSVARVILNLHETITRS